MVALGLVTMVTTKVAGTAGCAQERPIANLASALAATAAANDQAAASAATICGAGGAARIFSSVALLPPFCTRFALSASALVALVAGALVDAAVLGVTARSAAALGAGALAVISALGAAALGADALGADTLGAAALGIVWRSAAQFAAVRSARTRAFPNALSSARLAVADSSLAIAREASKWSFCTNLSSSSRGAAPGWCAIRCVYAGSAPLFVLPPFWPMCMQPPTVQRKRTPSRW
jgi:hypothetical protein